MGQVCTQDILKNADQFQVTTIVRWPENKASDNMDGAVM